MKNIGRMLWAFLFAIAITRSAFALDPSVFLKILDVDVKNLKGESGDFVQVRKLLGDAKRIDTGDAAEYEGRVEYILSDRSQSIAFKIGECWDGYVVEKVDKTVKRFNRAVLNASIKTLSTGGLSLGMNKKDVEKLFEGAVSGGWKLEGNKILANTRSVTFTKNIVENEGEKFCDHLQILLTFDAREKLCNYDVASGGCDDEPCR